MIFAVKNDIDGRWDGGCEFTAERRRSELVPGIVSHESRDRDHAKIGTYIRICSV